MSWLYLATIVASMLCMGLVDHRWKLFFITFLCYITGVFHGLFTRVLGRGESAREVQA